MYVQSTGVDRTLQSTYSEMMGFYPSSEQAEVVFTDKALPPMRVRSKYSAVIDPEEFAWS